MGEDRYVTRPPAVDTYWSTTLCMILLLLIYYAVSYRIGTLWGAVLWWIAVVMGGGGLYALLCHYLLYGDIILTREGIHRDRRLKTPDVPWGQISQVTAMDYGNTKLLVLLKSGGKKIAKGNSKVGFFLRNSGKTILLPDDPYCRRAVAEFYGPVDLELSDAD